MHQFDARPFPEGPKHVAAVPAEKPLAQSRLIEAREKGCWAYGRLRSGTLDQLQAWLAAPARCCPQPIAGWIEAPWQGVCSSS